MLGGIKSLVEPWRAARSAATGAHADAKCAGRNFDFYSVSCTHACVTLSSHCLSSKPLKSLTFYVNFKIEIPVVCFETKLIYKVNY